MTERNPDPNQPETTYNKAEMEDLPVQTLVEIANEKLQRATNAIDQRGNLHIREQLHNAIDGRDYTINTLGVRAGKYYFDAYRASEPTGQPQHLEKQLPELPNLPEPPGKFLKITVSDPSDMDTEGAFRCKVYDFYRMLGRLHVRRLDTYVHDIEQFADQEFAEKLSEAQYETAKMGLDQPDTDELMELCRGLEDAKPIFQSDKAQRRPELN